MKGPQVFFNKGVCYLKTGDKRSAIGCFTSSYAEDSKYIKSILERAKCYASLEKYNEALQDLNLYIRSNPNDPEAYYVRGVTKLTMNDYNGAVFDLTTCLDIKPDYMSAAENLAMAQYQLKITRKRSIYIQKY